MLVLRVDAAQPQTGSADIVISLSEHNTLLHEVRVPFDNPTSPGLLEDLRWLMEDFLADATSAGPVRAASTNTRLLQEGERLFHAMFEGTAECKHCGARSNPGCIKLGWRYSPPPQPSRPLFGS